MSEGCRAGAKAHATALRLVPAKPRVPGWAASGGRVVATVAAGVRDAAGATVRPLAEVFGVVAAEGYEAGRAALGWLAAAVAKEVAGAGAGAAWAALAAARAVPAVLAGLGRLVGYMTEPFRHTMAAATVAVWHVLDAMLATLAAVASTAEEAGSGLVRALEVGVSGAGSLGEVAGGAGRAALAAAGVLVPGPGWVLGGAGAVQWTSGVVASAAAAAAEAAAAGLAWAGENLAGGLDGLQEGLRSVLAGMGRAAAGKSGECAPAPGPRGAWGRGRIPVPGARDRRAEPRPPAPRSCPDHRQGAAGVRRVGGGGGAGGVGVPVRDRRGGGGGSVSRGGAAVAGEGRGPC